MMEKRLIPAGYKLTEAGAIPDDWEIDELGNLSPFIGSGKTATNGSGEYLLFGSTGVIGTCKSPEYSGDAILVARVGANAGRLNFVTGEYGVSDNTIIVRIKSGFNVVFFKYQLIKKNLNTLVFGSGQPLITGSQLKALLLPVPTIEEQTAIANALSDVDALIAALEKLINKKSAIKTAAMQQLLTGKKRLPPFDQLNTGYKQTELGEIPGDWEVGDLPQYVWYQEGPGVRKSQFTQRGVKLLNGTNIERGFLRLDKTERFISEEEAYGSYLHFLADEGDILIACSGVTISKFEEKVTVAKDTDLPLCMNTSTMRFKVYPEKLVKLYFVNYLKSELFKKQIGGVATGSAQLNFGPYHVDRAFIVLPGSVEEQTAIANVLSDMDKDLEALQQRLHKTQQIKQGMMQELLTGKTRLVSVNTVVNQRENIEN